MRHQRKRHRLGRGHAHRKATLAALSTALIAHKRISTTVPKAKALRQFVEPLITRAKIDSTHNRRQVFRHLHDKAAVTELFGEVAERVGDRPGGYTRIIRLGQRAGDGAEMAMIELVDYNDVQPSTTRKRRRTRRGGGGGGRRRGSGSTKAQQPEATPPQAAPQTVPVTETTGQTPTKEQGVDTTTVEQPVSPEQAIPVPERTEPHAEARAIAAEQAEEETTASTGEAPPQEPEAAEPPTAEVTPQEPEAPEQPASQAAPPEPEAPEKQASEEDDQKEK